MRPMPSSLPTMDEWTSHRPTLAAQRRSLQAHLSLVLGDADETRRILEEAPDATRLEIVHEQARLALARNDVDAARLVLSRWPAHPQPRARVLHTLWSAVVAIKEGDPTAAVDHVSTVIGELEAEDQVALLLDVGRPLLGPLRTLSTTAPTPFLDRMIVHPMLAGPRNATSIRGLAEQLTAQEMVVLGYLPSWLSNTGIAEQLGVSINTVKTHLKHIYRKLDVTDRREAIDAAERLGLL